MSALASKILLGSLLVAGVAARRQWTGKGSVDTWAMEGVGFACSAAYINTDGKLIDPNGTVGDNALTAAYYTSRMRVVTQRLQQGGVRLAALLNKVLG